MIKSGRKHSFSLVSSLNQSKQSFSQNQKKYRCDCCKDKKHHDYNRQRRLVRQSVSSKRLIPPNLLSSQKVMKENVSSFTNQNLISNIQTYQVNQIPKSKTQRLPDILQSPHLNLQHQKKEQPSNLKTPKIDMKSYCKNLFQSSKKENKSNFIEIVLNGDTYRIDFDSTEKMKLAIGELKLLIFNSEKLDNIKKIN